MWKDSDRRYRLVTTCMHWMIALGLIGLGAYMVDLTYYDPWYHRSLSWHRSLGLIVFALAVLFVLWKRVSRSPQLPDTISGAQRIVATAVHHVLVLMMLLMPITGYLFSASAGQAIPMFGWFEVPVLLKVSESVRDTLIAIHFYWP